MDTGSFEMKYTFGSSGKAYAMRKRQHTHPMETPSTVPATPIIAPW